jgi:hypothetical protein
MEVAGGERLWLILSRLVLLSARFLFGDHPTRPIVADHREIPEPRGTASARRSCATYARGNLTELNMITHVEAARMMDERLVRAVRRAEEQNGFKTGLRYSS